MRLVKSIVLISIGLFSSSILAVDLLMVYKQASVYDPTFQVASAQWLSEKENIAINRGALLPAFDIDANYGRVMQDLKSQNNRIYYNQGGYSLSLTQPIFNFQAWAKLAQAKANVKSAAASYADAAQNLIYRTATRYLAVLQAEDVLRFSIAQRKAAWSLLDQTKQRFNVGLSTVTDVQQAQANYDSAVSTEITAKNDLDVTKEQLREITGQYNKFLAPLGTKLPLLTPEPNNIEKWVAASERQNYSLVAALYNLQAARENIKVQAGNGFPVINAIGQYSYSNYGSNSDIITSSSSGTEALAGVNTSFPLLRGGTTVAQIQQARCDYQKASASLAQTHSTVVSQTSQAFLGVISGISSVKAGRQSVISNQSALNSTRASYAVGVKTIVDVLMAESSLYQAQKDYAVSEYTYLTQMLALKQQAGTLGVDDLRKINSWLMEERAKSSMIIKPGYMKVSHPVKVAHSIKKGKRMLIANTAMERKILSINPKHYTLQLLAADKPDKLMALVNQYKIARPVYTFKVNNNGHVWYDLIAGEYNTLDEAKWAERNLLKRTKNVHPWIRTFSSIQSAMMLVNMQ
jgi:outer membrane protein